MAGGNLFEADPFVGLVGLFDVAGAADDGGDAGALVLAAFGGVGDSGGRIGAGELEGQSFGG